MKKQGIFITGTGTGVGKTIVSAAIVAASDEQQIRYFKPIQTGIEDDTRVVAELTGTAAIRPPVYYFTQASAPSRAAAAEGKALDLAIIKAAWDAIPSGRIVVEGGGGILVPLTQKETTRDLIKLLDLPLLIVASTTLGTINHTLLSVEAAKASGISIAGIILVGEKDNGLSEIITNFTTVPVLAELPQLQTVSRQTIGEAAQAFSRAGVLESIFPKNL